MTTLQEKLASLQQLDFDVRFNALSDAWGNDPERVAMFGRAVEMIKEAEEKGEFGSNGLTDSQVVTLAADLVEDAVRSAATAVAEEEEVEEEEEAAEPEASEEDAEEEEEDSEEQVKEAAFAELAGLCMEPLKEAGITLQDLEKIATVEEAEQVGHFIAQYVLNLLAEQE